jgi:hypothetical protein
MSTVTGASTQKIAPRATAATKNTNQRLRVIGARGSASNGLKASVSHTAKKSKPVHVPRIAKPIPTRKSAHPNLRRIALNNAPPCWTPKITTPVWALATRQQASAPRKMLEISTKFVTQSAWQIHRMSTMQTASTTTG